MKKIIIFWTVLVLMTSMVMAGLVPHPIGGAVTDNGAPVRGIDVRVQNLNNGMNIVTQTINTGYYQIDLGNYDPEFRGGDSIKVSLVHCESESRCSKTVVISGGGNRIDFDLSGTEYPEDPEPEEPVDKLSSNEAKTSSSIDLLYGQEVNIVIANNKIAKLADDEIKFNGETYDFREEVILVGDTKTSIDDIDYLLDVYLEIEELSYSYTFDDLIDLAEITKDEVLEITFLGKNLSISSASTDSITFISGTEYNLKEGASVEINGKTLTVQIISGDAVNFIYDGSANTINEGDIEEVGDIEIYVSDAIESDRGSLVTFRAGVDIEEIIEDGDDYDDKFEWVIDLPNSIGIINQDPFNDLEDNPPVKAGEVISLPEDFLDIKLSVPSVNMYDLNIEVDGAYLLVEGEFSKDTEDYSEVYLNSNGFYDEDEVFIGTSVEIGDSNIALEMGSLVIGDLKIELDMSDILLNGISYALKDEDFLDYLGVIFLDPEQAVEDQRNFEVSVPEERPEATIIIGEEVAPDEDEEVICPITPVCTETDCQDTVCPNNPPVLCDDVLVCKECPDEEGFGLGAIIASILIAAGAGVGVTYYTRKDYNTCKGVTVKTRIDTEGREKVEHLHRGLKGYHDPKTSHSDPKEKHPRGELYPRYEKDETGKYVYIPE